MPRRISLQCACVSTKPGTIVLPLTSNTLAPAGTLPFAPTLLMRLFSTTISAFFRTSSPFIVTTVAPRRMIVPFGVRRFERDGAQGFAEKARAHCPGDGLAAIGPREIIRADVRQPLCRDCGGGHIDGWRFPTD